MHRPTTLAQLAVGEAATVRALRAPAAAPAWERYLEDLGFVPGEPVKVLRRALARMGPLVVRVGAGATIALRHDEAACIVIGT